MERTKSARRVAQERKNTGRRALDDFDARERLVLDRLRRALGLVGAVAKFAYARVSAERRRPCQHNAGITSENAAGSRTVLRALAERDRHDPVFVLR